MRARIIDLTGEALAAAGFLMALGSLAAGLSTADAFDAALIALLGR